VTTPSAILVITALRSWPSAKLGLPGRFFGKMLRLLALIILFDILLFKIIHLKVFIGIKGEKMNIVLLEPEIPHNTGAIGRTCLCAGAGLHLIRPLGFLTDEKTLRRTGLDYWKDINLTYHDSYEDFLRFMKNADPKAKIWYSTTKAKKCYTDVSYGENDYILFGKESAGIPVDILKANAETCVRVPMMEGKRSLNLSVSAGIVLYEALRQSGFTGLLRQRDDVL
jgi:tRNA (cytidine/uridine-2'-O-)-methyltransferase